MAAIARSTPSFTLPATQNTAPVHEFRCLYSHDVRKKTKKWHDGTARFHTFNRRVMVYDDTKNYIGDLHYRADEEFDVGVELQLDRGVLVEIGERIGTTQTDLTGIVNQPHGNHGDASASSTATRPQSIQRVNHMNNQGRPKSLAELLGPSQGRLGRAILAPTSPFEQRQATTGFSTGEPALKRQKRALGKENVYSSAQHTVMSPPTRTAVSTKPPALPPVSVQPVARSVVPTKATTRSSVGHRRVIDISSDEEIQPEPITSPVTVHRPVVRVDSSKSGHRRASEERNRITKKTTISKAYPPASVEDDTIFSNHPKPPLQFSREQASRSTLPSADSNSSLQPGMTSLKMRSQPVRRKLMYKALLPSSVIDQDERPHLTTFGQGDEVENDDVFVADLEIQPPTDEEFEELIQENRTNQLPSTTTKVPPDPQNVPLTPPGRGPTAQSLQPSPLFVSQTRSQRSPTPADSFVEDDFGILGTQELIRHGTGEPEISIETEMEIDKVAHETGPESPCFPLPPARSKPTTQNTPEMLPPPQPLPSPPLLPHEPLHPHLGQRTPSPSKSRPFARSLSADDSPLLNDPRASPSYITRDPIEESPIILRGEQFSPLNPPAPLRFQPPKANPPTAKSKPKSPIQRTRSDTAAIIPTTTAPMPQPDPDSVDEQGPWTSLEAFLLFDKWPACKAKDKPAFEYKPTNRDGNGEGDNEEDGFGFVPSPPPRKMPPVLIRSARSFMRDGC